MWQDSLLDTCGGLTGIIISNWFWNRKGANLERLAPFVYPALMGSKTPTSKFSESKEVRWGSGCPLKSDWLGLIISVG